MRLDSHQHFWKYDPKRQPWINEEMKVIRKNFLPEDLFPLMEQTQIEGCIAVQADESIRETAFLCDLALEYDFIKGVVGWADLASDDLDKDLDQFADQVKLKGYREVLQSKNVDYMLRPEFIRGINKLGKRGYTYDILIFANQLEATYHFAKKAPEQPFVINHLAKPKVKLGIWREWKKELSLLAERDYIFCKLSGIITEADWKKWRKEELKVYLDTALELFGPKRLMFGSDWPVCLVAGQYEQVLEIIELFIQPLSQSEKAQIMGGTAMEFYGITS
jgi:L-fuconolactonase